MKILIVSYYYAPSIDAHRYRWEQIAEYLASQGHNVQVITASQSSGNEPERRNGVLVRRASGMLSGVIARSAGPSGNVSRSAAPSRGGVRAVLTSAVRNIYRRIYWPDALWHWFPTLFVQLWKSRRERYDLVATYYPSMASHLAVLVARKAGLLKADAWIADYGDPFSGSVSMPPNNLSLYGSLNVKAEKAVARNANFVSFTNLASVRAYQKATGGLGHASVVPHLVDIQKFHNGCRLERFQSSQTPGALRLLYIGGFHANIREPYFLLDLLKKISGMTGHDLKLDIYGPENGFEILRQETPYFEFHGPAKREDVLALMSRTDVLVNVDNKNCIMVPSKIVEIIATGIPILNVHAGGLTHEAMNKYVEAGYAFQVEEALGVDGQFAQVANFLSGARAKRVDKRVVRDVLHEYDLPSVVASYLAQIPMAAGLDSTQ